MSSQSSRYVRFGVVIAVIVVALSYLAYTGVQDSKSYYVTIKELNGMGDGAYSKRPFRWFTAARKRRLTPSRTTLRRWRKDVTAKTASSTPPTSRLSAPRNMLQSPAPPLLQRAKPRRMRLKMSCRTGNDRKHF